MPKSSKLITLDYSVLDKMGKVELTKVIFGSKYEMKTRKKALDERINREVNEVTSPSTPRNGW